MESDSAAAGTGNADITINLSYGTSHILKKVTFYAPLADPSNAFNLLTIYDGIAGSGTALTGALHIGTLPNSKVDFNEGITLSNDSVGFRISRAESTSVFMTAWYVYN